MQRIRGWRWALPLAASAVLLLLFALSRTGTVSGTLVFAVMGILTFGVLIWSTFLQDTAVDDRRADLPLAVFATWAVLWLIESGLIGSALMASTWFLFTIGVGVALSRDYGWRWIGLGLLALIVVNLTLLFALYRG